MLTLFKCVDFKFMEAVEVGGRLYSVMKTHSHENNSPSVPYNGTIKNIIVYLDMYHSKQEMDSPMTMPSLLQTPCL